MHLFIGSLPFFANTPSTSRILGMYTVGIYAKLRKEESILSKTRKIIFILGGMTFGGAERVISILANHYAQKHWQVTIVTLLKSGCDFPLHPSIRLLHLGDSEKSRLQRLPAWLWGLRKVITQEKPDAVVSFAARINLLVLLATLCKKRPHTVISERNDPMHDSRTSPVRLLTNIFYPSADCIVFQTQYALQCFPSRIGQKGQIIPNPVTPHLPLATRKDNRIVSVGKLMPQKNHANLLRAFSSIASEFPDYTLHIYGDGPLRDDTQRLITQLHLEQRAFLEGWKADIPSEISSASFFVLSSNYEGLSNALMEAVAMGLPCVSTDCAGAKDLIVDGISGTIVPVGDADALANALRIILSDPAYAQQCALKAREHAQAFSTERIIAQWEEVIERPSRK